MKLTAFEILNLPADAAVEEIRQRWRALAAEHHPDVGGELTKFLHYKSAYERALTQAQSRPCGSCDGAGKVPKRKRGSVAVTWEVCESCSGSGKSKNH